MMPALLHFLSSCFYRLKLIAFSVLGCSEGCQPLEDQPLPIAAPTFEPLHRSQHRINRGPSTPSRQPRVRTNPVGQQPPARFTSPRYIPPVLSCPYSPPQIPPTSPQPNQARVPRRVPGFNLGKAADLGQTRGDSDPSWMGPIGDGGDEGRHSLGRSKWRVGCSATADAGSTSRPPLPSQRVAVSLGRLRSPCAKNKSTYGFIRASDSAEKLDFFVVSSEEKKEEVEAAIQSKVERRFRSLFVVEVED